MRNFALHQAQQTGELPSVGILTRLWNNWKARRTTIRLADFDDHMLRDIGLTRGHIEAARYKSLTENPMLELKKIIDASPGCVACANYANGILDPRNLRDTFKRDIGWLDGHTMPGSTR